tara:strand:- start:211 stop:489 length:279 start_codon:yes stop_codon:yes gene_type:complete
MSQVVNKIHNEYAELLSGIYSKTPKAVLAAVAVSLLMQSKEFHRLNDGPLGSFVGEELFAARLKKVLVDEWEILHANGIIPQSPKAVKKVVG